LAFFDARPRYAHNSKYSPTELNYGWLEG